MSLVLSTPGNVAGKIFNVSDVVVDRRELLEMAAEIVGHAGNLPASADRSALNVMSCGKLRALGWQPGGKARLAGFLREYLLDVGANAKQ